MKQKTKIAIAVGVFLLLFVLLVKYKFTNDTEIEAEIEDDGILTVALGRNVESYFLNKAQVYGFQYELLKNFADSIKQELLLVREDDIDKRLELLLSHKADLIVCDKKIDSIKNLETIILSQPLNEKISPTCWAVYNKKANIIDSVNSWIEQFKNTKDYKWLVWKYNSKNKLKLQTTISEYDNIIRKYSNKIGWDWRLVASLICQESQFNSDLISSRGAIGLMQIMPETANFLRIDSVNTNETNIWAGTKLLKYMDSEFIKDSTINESERVKFVLASYNAGIGKIETCRKILAQNGKNATIWDSVANELYKNPEYERKHLLRSQTINFVNEIIERYKHYSILADD